MNDLFTLFAARLAGAGIDAVVTGSVAAMLYGEPRLTHDIDLVVLLNDASIDALVRAFPDDEFYCAPAEVIRVEARRSHRGHFNIIHHETGCGSEKHVQDIRGMLRQQAGKIELDTIADRVVELGLEHEWQRVLEDRDGMG